MGRTGHLFACSADDVTPDIVCIAKGLGAGYQPIGAMLCTKRIYDVIAEGSGFFQHGHTYVGHPVAAAAALAVLKEILENDLIAQVRKRGTYFEAQLRKRFGATSPCRRDSGPRPILGGRAGQRPRIQNAI